MKGKLTIKMDCTDATREELVSEMPRMLEMIEKGFNQGEILLDMDSNKTGWWTAEYKEVKGSRKKSGMYSKVSLEKKIDFIKLHLSLFNELYNLIGKYFVDQKANTQIRALAILARKELGYSETTYAPDIIRGIYDIYLKKFTL